MHVNKFVKGNILYKAQILNKYFLIVSLVFGVKYKLDLKQGLVVFLEVTFKKIICRAPCLKKYLAKCKKYKTENM